jgi:hypothetical protein
MPLPLVLLALLLVKELELILIKRLRANVCHSYAIVRQSVLPGVSGSMREHATAEGSLE